MGSRSRTFSEGPSDSGPRDAKTARSSFQGAEACQFLTTTTRRGSMTVASRAAEHCVAAGRSSLEAEELDHLAPWSEGRVSFPRSEGKGMASW